MIIGLVGFIGAGKGTVGDILVRNHGYHRFAFADALKDAVSTIFLWPRGLLEGDSNASRAFRERVDVWWSHKLGYEVTPRLILQKFGTEACREGIADNIWIAALEKRIQGYDDVVISDVRFPNEIDFIRSAGGTIVRVCRGEDPTPEELSKMHISETAWNNVISDIKIFNNGTVDDLKKEVKTVLTLEEKPRTIFHHPV
jgi:rhodanese-related sulfurtransferase